MAAGRVQADAAKRLLAELAVRFQPVAESAAADHLKALESQRVLFTAFGGRFEQRDALLAGLAQPPEFGPPIVREFQHAAVNIAAAFILDEHPDFVAALHQSVVHGAQVIGLADPEEPHAAGLWTTSATAAIRSACWYAGASSSSPNTSGSSSR